MRPPFALPTSRPAATILSLTCVWLVLQIRTGSADIRAIERITVPDLCCTQSHPSIDNLFDVQAPPFPFNDGSDERVGPAGPGWLVNIFDIEGNPIGEGLTNANDFGYHNRTEEIVAEFVPDPAKTYIEYTFSDPLVINGVEILEHHFGISELEGFLGDSPDSVSSLGVARGDARGPYSPEKKSVRFAFDNTNAGTFFRVVPTRIVHGNAFAVYRIFPTVDGERVIGAGTTDAPPVGYVETIAFDNPVAYWRFEEDPASGTAVDESPRDGPQNGTYVGGLTSIAGLDGSASGPDSRPYVGLPAGNRALSFDGSSGRVDVPDDPVGVLKSNRALTIEFLLRNSPSDGAIQTLFSKGSFNGPNAPSTRTGIIGIRHLADWRIEQ